MGDVRKRSSEAFEREIDGILKKLRVPPGLSKAYRIQEEEEAGKEFLSSASLLLENLIKLVVSRKEIVSKEVVKHLLPSLATFACVDDEGETSFVLWTTDELRSLANSAIDDLAAIFYSSEASINPIKARERLVHEQLQEALPTIHCSLRHGTKKASSEAVYSGERYDSSYDIVLAYQMTWLLQQVGHPFLGRECQIVIPCVLTALDHYSPPIKRQGLRSALLLARNMDSSELRWYKDVLLDAVHQNIAGSDDLWPLVVKTAVFVVTRIEGRNSRSPWYRKFLTEMFGELERHQDDTNRANLWLVEAETQLQAMGLVIVAHFRRLFILLFYWLKKSDKTTSVLVLSCLRLIITQTWPRIPYHSNRILEELMKVYRDVKDEETREAIMETASLLVNCIPETWKALHRNKEEAKLIKT